MEKARWKLSPGDSDDEEPHVRRWKRLKRILLAIGLALCLGALVGAILIWPAGLIVGSGLYRGTLLITAIVGLILCGIGDAETRSMLCIAAIVMFYSWMMFLSYRPPPAGSPEERAVAALQKLGAKLTPEPYDPYYGFFHSGYVTEVSLAGRATDAALAHLKSLPGLQRLDVRDSRVTDAGLVHLKRLRLLQSLNLSGTGVSDAGLAHLSRLTKLQSLDLSGTGVTEAGVEELRKALSKTSKGNVRIDWGQARRGEGQPHVKPAGRKPG
jgi:hypothetical protein